MKERLSRLPVIGWLLRIQDRFGEVNGTALANGIALQTFLSIFPLLIVAVSVIGFISEGESTFTADVIESLGIPPGDELATNLGEAIENAQDSKAAAGVVGLAGLLYSGLAVVVALQRAVDRSWQTFGAGILDKVRALGVIIGAGVILAGSVALTVLINFLPGFFAPISIVAGLLVSFALFLFLFTFLGRLPVGWRAMVPGAVTCAVGLEVLKLVGTVYVPKLVANSSALYGSLGVVVAALAWLGFFGRLVVYGAVVNVVHYEDQHGTVSVPVHAPRVTGALPVEANRSGAVTDRLEE